MPAAVLPFGQAMTPETVWGIGTAEELKDQLYVPAIVLRVAIQLPCVGVNPGPVIVPLPLSVMRSDATPSSDMEERVSENPPTDHNAPTGRAPAGLTAIGVARVVIERDGREA
jgi:hypothetical protein